MIDYQNDYICLHKMDTWHYVMSQVLLTSAYLKSHGNSCEEVESVFFYGPFHIFTC